MEDSYLRKLLGQVILKINQGDPEDWNITCFSNLSNELYKASKIRISHSTLKRLFGRKKTYKDFYNPQPATKNSLSKYLGFEDWDTFKVGQPIFKDNPVEEQPIIVKDPIIDRDPIIIPKSSFAKFFVPFCMIFLIVTVGTIVFFWGEGKEKTSFLFTATKTPGEGTLSIHLKYDASSLPDSTYIDFGDNDRFYRSPQKGKVSHYYHETGYYPVQLRNDDYSYKTIGMFCETNDWSCKYITRDKKIYRGNCKSGLQSGLYLSPDTIIKNGIDYNEVDWVNYHSIGTMEVDGDDFSFQTSIQNSFSTGAIASYETLVILGGETGYFQLEILKPGSFYWAEMHFGEKHIWGRNEDFAFLQRDMLKPHTLSLEVKNQKAVYFIDGKKVFETTYTQPIGKIKGLVYIFRGSGKVYSYQFKNSGGKIIKEELF